MTPLVPPSPPAAPPPILSRSARRWWAAAALLAGGILAAAGLFAPWVGLDYPVIEGDHATNFSIAPGTSFALYLRGLVIAPYRFSVAMTVLSLIFFGAPLLFAVLGARALLPDGWIPTRRVRRTSLIFAVIGTVLTLLAAAFLIFFADAFAVIQPTRTLQPGAGAALLGYLLALVGAILLPARPRPPRR